MTNSLSFTFIKQKHRIIKEKNSELEQCERCGEIIIPMENCNFCHGLSNEKLLAKIETVI